MNKIALLILLIVCGCVPAYSPGPELAPVPDASYERVIELPGVTRKDAFERSKQWLALTYVSSKKVIEYENETEGKIIGNGASSIVYVFEGGFSRIPINYQVGYVINEDIRDGKVRIVFNNVGLLNNQGSKYEPIYADGWKQLRPRLEQLAFALEAYLKSSSKGQDW